MKWGCIIAYSTGKQISKKIEAHQSFEWWVVVGVWWGYLDEEQPACRLFLILCMRSGLRVSWTRQSRYTEDEAS